MGGPSKRAGAKHVFGSDIESRRAGAERLGIQVAIVLLNGWIAVKTPANDHRAGGKERSPGLYTCTGLARHFRR